MKTICVAAVSSMILVMLSTSLTAQYKITSSTFGGGGGSISSGAHTLSSTIGQPLIGATGNNNNFVLFGFWYTVQVEFVTSMERVDNSLPGEFRLEQNYPNPFNPSTQIRYDIPEQTHVTITVYDVLGREITTLVNETQSPGGYEVTFNAGLLPSGLYLYRIQAGNFSKVMRMMYVR